MPTGRRTIATRARGSEGEVSASVAAWQARGDRIVPGFGHRWHDVDPRTVRLLAPTPQAEAKGELWARIGWIAAAIERVHTAMNGRPIPLRIDGVCAAIDLALGFGPALGRGQSSLVRSVGILAHAWAQREPGGRIQGPMSPGVD